MTVINFFDSMARSDTEQLAELADKLVEAALADLKQIDEYDRMSRVAVDPDDEERWLDVARSVFQMYKDWWTEAHQLFERARRLKAEGVTVNRGRELALAIGRVGAHLQLTPERLALARRQAREGQVIPLRRRGAAS